ncbi:ISL3 family transposase [Granulicatella balaenopterae]
MSHSTQIFLQIKDPNVTLYDELTEEVVVKGKKSIVAHGKVTYKPKACEHCGCKNEHFSIVKNGTRSSTITLLPCSGMDTSLELSKQRFKCKHCKKSFTAETDIVDKNCFIAKSVKLHVADQLFNEFTETIIAKQHNVSVHTVRRITRALGKKLVTKPWNSLPTHLCFDKFKSVKSSHAAMSFIYCDAKTHQLIDIIEDRRCHNLIDYFMRFSLKTRQAVDTVIIDMYKPYITLINTVFPNAKIIIDPFHIVQAINRELNKTRVKVMNSFKTKNRRLYNKYKRYWKLLLAKTETLDSYTYSRYPLFDWMTNTCGIVDYLLEQSEELKATYRIAHQLRDALADKDFEQFKAALIEAKHSPISKGLRRLIRTFTKLLPYIENTFNYPYTNGPIEGLNNKIKVLKRNAYGYRNFDHFKARIFLMMKLYAPDPKKQTLQHKTT